MKDERKKDPEQPLITRRKLLTYAGWTAAGVAAVLLARRELMSRSPVAIDEVTDTGTYEAFNVKDYGAVGDGRSDDSPAFSKAIDEIAVTGSGVLYVPSGDYRMDTRISKSLKSWALAIVGDGEGVSRLLCTNKDGVFQFTHSRSAQITIRDISFFADRPDSGTAIEIVRPEGGNFHSRTLVMHNVEMRGVDIDQDYFNIGVRVVGQYRPLFLNVIFAGPFGPKVSKDRKGEADDIYKATCGILIEGTYAPSVQHCYIWSCQTGCKVVSEKKPGPEDCAFYNTFIVECRVGMDISTESIEPQLEIDRCHVNCRDAGIRIRRRKYFSITNCLLYNSLKEDHTGETGNDPPYSDIQLIDCMGGIITDNIFHQPLNSQRKMIELTGKTSDISIKDNLFNANGIAIAVEASAKGIVGVNNRFTEEVTQVLDDASAGITFGAQELNGALLRMTDGRPIPQGGWSSIVWNAAEYDKGSMWDGTAGFVIPNHKGIRYVRLTANLAWEGNSSGAWCQAEFTKNGESFVGNGKASQLGGGLNIQSAVIPVQAGDAFGVRVRHRSGGTLALSSGAATWFSLEAING
jgi:hypothetical protein